MHQVPPVCALHLCSARQVRLRFTWLEELPKYERLQRKSKLKSQPSIHAHALPVRFELRPRLLLPEGDGGLELCQARCKVGQGATVQRKSVTAIRETSHITCFPRRSPACFLFLIQLLSRWVLLHAAERLRAVGAMKLRRNALRLLAGLGAVSVALCLESSSTFDLPIVQSILVHRHGDR